MYFEGMYTFNKRKTLINLIYEQEDITYKDENQWYLCQKYDFKIPCIAI